MVNIVTPISSQKWDVSKEGNTIKRSLTTKAKVSILVGLALVTLVVVVIVICFLLPRYDFWPSYISDSKLGKYKMAALSTDAAPCAPIGRDIFERGGTAVDAAIAILVCMGAHNPHSMGLGGGFLMLFYNRTEGRAYYMDAREVAPEGATEDMFQANATLAGEGGLSIAVPGELAGYSVAHKNFGSLDWKELFKPTIEMCRQGIEVSAHLARAIRNTKEKLIKYGDIADVFLKNRTDVYTAGERLKMPTLADTLETIAKQGMKALYGPSELADKFLKDLGAAKSIITKDDMLDYAPMMRQPVQVKLRKNTTLYGVSSPGSGSLLAFMMSILDGYEDLDESVSSDKQKAALSYHRIVETLKYAYAFRSHLEDSDSDSDEAQMKLAAKLASREYADEIRKRINDSTTFNDPWHYDFQWDFKEDHGTAHLSLVAPNGDAVSVTSTINQYFGSKILSPSTGIVLNDEMDDFSSPNITNMFDVPPTPMNHVKPGMRPMSSMTPMIMVDGNGNVTLVLGGNGGTMITSGVLQVAVRSFFFGEDIKQSIDAPRIHHQLRPDILHYENTFPKTMVEELRKFGHKPTLWDMGMMSIILGVHRGEDGYLYANSDYRKGGGVDGI